ncbi:Fic family protein [Microbacterium trichothecenolyticum]|uniref:Fic/DOC family protein n=1 Tax=Microbacterium trichothecenolyticum TaxID=69370 RepID=UPI00286C199B|nr:Fic family protein [Microbacterium trichothecenolyticum]
MAAEFNTWESYFYPDTYNEALGQGTLRNKLGERDFFTLRALEYAATALRERQLHDGTVTIARTFGADHLRAIHGHLFQDVYEWAGNFRTVNMGKAGGEGFARTRNGDVQKMLDAVQEYVHGEQWEQFDRGGFVKNAAVVFAFVNQAHPFREGNGRTSKVFMQHVADQTRFTFDFSRVDPDAWNIASELSRPNADRNLIDPVPLLPIFGTATVDRSPVAPAAPQPPRDLRSASYPEPARYTTRNPSSGRQEVQKRPGRYRSGPAPETER